MTILSDTKCDGPGERPTEKKQTQKNKRKVNKKKTKKKKTKKQSPQKIGDDDDGVSEVPSFCSATAIRAEQGKKDDHNHYGDKKEEEKNSEEEKVIATDDSHSVAAESDASSVTVTAIGVSEQRASSPSLAPDSIPISDTPHETGDPPFVSALAEEEEEASTPVVRLPIQAAESEPVVHSPVPAYGPTFAPQSVLHGESPDSETPVRVDSPNSPPPSTSAPRSILHGESPDSKMPVGVDSPNSPPQSVLHGESPDSETPVRVDSSKSPPPSTSLPSPSIRPQSSPGEREQVTPQAPISPPGDGFDNEAQQEWTCLVHNRPLDSTKGGGIGSGDGAPEGNIRICTRAYNSGSKTNGNEWKEQDNASKDNLTLLSDHMINRLQPGFYSDFEIVLRSSNEIFMPISFHAHKVVISRSPLVAQILEAGDPKKKNSPARRLVAASGDNFCLILGFELALKHLYGLPLLNASNLRGITLANFGYDEDTVKRADFEITAAMTDLAICYATSGAFFQIDQVVERGMKLAIDILCEGSLEVMFHFGLHIAKAAVILDPTADEEPGEEDKSQSKSKGKGKTKGKNNSNKEKENKSEKKTTEENKSTPTHNPIALLQKTWAPRLVTSALRFLIDRVDGSFILDPTAHCQHMDDRIPKPLIIPASSEMSQLRSKVFGYNIPPSLASPKTKTLSGVLLGLPFQQLRAAFLGMAVKRSVGETLAHVLVMEREARRCQALAALTQVAGVNLDDPNSHPEEVRELGYREYFKSKEVENSSEATAGREVEISLHREWSGLHPPQFYFWPQPLPPQGDS
ncbi:hypothetical protein FE257_012651 [Aspergillus nanangensis]|uniref:BTB domain-containing protein n=1 Tax=Aspergillus nanangensis TaxID=2582783 RepID=A0AAD4CFS4_ASPNN|nr:hypothetical protein FE257_012651 [Aspergillus nanangensis]